MIDRGHQVRHVGVAPALVGVAGEFLAVSRGTARIGIDDDITIRCQELEFVHKGFGVHAVRTTVDFENHRIFDLGVKSGRFDDPALYRNAVWRVNPEWLRFREGDTGEKCLVDVRKSNLIIATRI